MDPDIEAKLLALEAEEDALLAEAGNAMDDDELPHLDEEQEEAYNDYKNKVSEIRVKARLNRNNRTILKTQDGVKLKDKLIEMGKDGTKIVDKLKAERNTKSKRVGLKAMLEKEKMRELMDKEDGMDIETGDGNTTRSKTRSRSRTVGMSIARDVSRQRTPTVYDEMSQAKLKVTQKKRNLYGKQGEGDNRITCDKPKHLYAGKMDFKRDRR